MSKFKVGDLVHVGRESKEVWHIVTADGEYPDNDFIVGIKPDTDLKTAQQFIDVDLVRAVK